MDVEGVGEGGGAAQGQGLAPGLGLGQEMVIHPAEEFSLLGGFSNIGSMCGLSNIGGLGEEEKSHQLTNSMTHLRHPLICLLIHIHFIYPIYPLIPSYNLPLTSHDRWFSWTGARNRSLFTRQTNRSYQCYRHSRY